MNAIVECATIDMQAAHPRLGVDHVALHGVLDEVLSLPHEAAQRDAQRALVQQRVPVPHVHVQRLGETARSVRTWRREAETETDRRRPAQQTGRST